MENNSNDKKKNTDNTSEAKTVIPDTDKSNDKKSTTGNAADNAGSKPAKQSKEMLDDIDDGDLILENVRESVPLTPSNASFFRSKGGLISLQLKNPDGETEFFERIILLRSFPVTNPDEFLAVRYIDYKNNSQSKEIGMIRYINDFDEATVRLFNEDLERRYFMPQINRINSVKEKFGYFYWDTETSAGHLVFILNNPFSNIRVIESGSVYINDIEGNMLEIPDPSKLDPSSFKKIEVYL